MHYAETFAARPTIWLLMLVASACGPPQSSPESIHRAFVENVIDGDTVQLTIGANSERVRLLGIDAPESVHPTVPVQCFGAEATAELRSLLPAGTEVEIFADEQVRDHYGRLLLYLYRTHDDLAVNLHLVQHGFAASSFYEPNVHFRSDIKGAERQAKAEATGLWGRCDGPDQPLE